MSCDSFEAGRIGSAPPSLVVPGTGRRAEGEATRPITADDLVGLRDIDAFLVSPDGASVAYLLRRADATRDAYDTGWFVVDVAARGDPIYLGDGGAPQLVTQGDGHQVGEVAPPRAAWSPDGRWLAYLVAQGGEVQLWRSDARGRRREQVTGLEADVLDFRWAPDGLSLVVAARGESRADAAAARAAEARRGFLLDDRFQPGHATTPLYLTAAQQADVVVWAVDAESGRLRPAAAVEAAMLAEASGASSDAGPDGDRVIDLRVAPVGDGRAWLVEDEDSVPFGGRRLRASMSGRSVDCVENACAGEIELVGWTGDGRRLVFLRRFGVAERLTGLYAWSPDEGGLTEILSGEALLAGCRMAAGGLAVCARETATAPRRLVAVDLATGAVRTLVDPNPELAAVRFGGVETIDLTNAWGHASFAQILTPPDYVAGRRYPVVVVTYRARGFLRGGVGDEYPAHLIAAAGFVVLAFDMPDPYDYPPESAAGTSTDASMLYPDCPPCAAGELRHAATTASLELGLEALERRDLMDPERVAVTGLSSGASIAFDALIRTDRRFAAVIVSYAAGDPVSGYVGRRAWREAWFADIGGLPERGGRRYLARVSPALNADRLTAPILMNVADRELIMSMQTIATLEHEGAPIETYVYPGERHVKRSPAHRDAIYRRNLQWLQFWLQDVEPEHPLDPGQIERWRALKQLRDERAALRQG